MTLRILYSYNKEGYVGKQWAREIEASSGGGVEFFPFNHGEYWNPKFYEEAHLLDSAYRANNPDMLRLYTEFKNFIIERNIDALVVNNCPPYHPDFLKNFSLYKVLYSQDDPYSTYRRNIQYLHAYQHVIFATPLHSKEMDMHEKMIYCGIKNADWVPIGVMDYCFNTSKHLDELITQKRNIDIIYVGSFFKQKLALLAKIKRRFGARFSLHGFFRNKHNLYFNVRYGARCWVRPVSYEQRVLLWQRAKIGINIHWSDWALGNERLYSLPANGVMQISDCSEHLNKIFSSGNEIVGYNSEEELLRLLSYYLDNEDERIRIVKNAYARVMNDYRFSKSCKYIGHLISKRIRASSSD